MDLGQDGERKYSTIITSGSKKEDVITVNVDNRAAIRQAIFNLVKEKTENEMIPHSDWGIQSSKEMEDDWDYDSIAIHHEGNSGSCQGDVIKVAETAQKKHLNRGFSDIGYHYIISCTGRIAEGRDIRKKGAHVNKNNTGIIGIVLQGDYTERGEASFWKDPSLSTLNDKFDFSNNDQISADQLKALKLLIDILMEFFEIKKLGGHREFALPGDHRTCPGNIAMEKVAILREKLSLSAP